MPATFRLLLHDSKRDAENWSAFAVVRIYGEMDTDPENPDRVTDEEMAAILRECAVGGLHFQSAGEGGPGRRFADAPWFDFFPGHVVVRQHGGLDV